MMNNEEFAKHILSTKEPKADILDWIPSAVGAIMVISSASENLSKDEIVSALQELSTSMPASLVRAGTIAAMETYAGM